MAQRIDQNEVRGATKFYRPAYEALSAAFWAFGALTYLVIARTINEDIAIVGYAAIPMAWMAFYRFHQAWQNWLFKARLTAPRPPWMTVEQLLGKQVAARQTFLGKGFHWEPYHARLMKEVSTIPRISALDPPPLFTRIMEWLGVSEKDLLLEGKHYIHGCGATEQDLFVSDQSRRSHTLVLGTNGAGKTRLLETLVAQSISRGAPTARDTRRLVKAKRKFTAEEWEKVRYAYEPKYGPVFILDPKGDGDLRDRAFATAQRLGRLFYYFSPTDSDYSFRINPLAKFNRRTELANRVVSLLPSGGDAEAFRQFAWRAINVVIEGLWFSNDDINLLQLRKYVEGGIDKLLVACLEKHLTENAESYRDWETDVRALDNRRAGGTSLDQQAAKRASALAAYYATKVQDRHPNTTIDGLIDVLTHDAAHYAKLISNLVPVLVQLTAGPMADLLSYRRGDTEDPRQVCSFQGLINENAIVYVNFESLADSVVGSALGSLFLADLTACAAVRHHKGITEPPVSIYVDEAAEMMNDPFIQALNKGRAAGFELTLASQTISDFISRMGNEAKALQVLGNINTTIAMRLQDNDSIKIVSEKFSETSYEERSSSKTSTTIATIPGRGRDFTGSVMKNSQSSELFLVTPDLLSSLPPGHFFGHLPGGTKVKGRVLMMRPDKDGRFDPKVHGKTRDRYEFSGYAKKRYSADVSQDGVEKVDLNQGRASDLNRSRSVTLPDPTPPIGYSTEPLDVAVG